MRVYLRFALLLVVVTLFAPAGFADHQIADCPLSLVASNPPSTNFGLSPAGVFRSGNFVHVLRGQTLATYTVNDLGDLQLAREDFIGSLGTRETDAGVAFANGFLYLSGEAGLEIYDLRNVRPAAQGGSAPSLVSRTPGLHYRQLAVSGTTLAGLFPQRDLPCNVTPISGNCTTTVDVFNVANPSVPIRFGTISSLGSIIGGFEDIAFASGILYVTGANGTTAYNINTPGGFFTTSGLASPGTFIVTNNTNLIAIGNQVSIDVYIVTANGTFPQLFARYAIPLYMTIDRANPIEYHRGGSFDEASNRLITMINELDPHTLEPARTIAFDVFDFSAPGFEGSAERFYEQLSEVHTDEVKYSPLAVGPYVYVVGEMSGLQTYGACDQITGQLEFDFPSALNCGGSELHGWVTGRNRIVNVEVFLDNTSLGSATLGGPPRTDISSHTPVSQWRINVNLDQTTRGEHTIRVIGTDALGNRRQFSSRRVLFGGPGQNCTNRRRTTAR